MLARALYTLGSVVPDVDSQPLFLEAKETWQKALALAPEDTEALLDYSRMLDDSKAREVLIQILEIDPKNSSALRSLGAILIAEGNVENGLDRMRESVEVATAPLDIEYNGRALVDRLEDLGRVAEAEGVRQLMKTKLGEPTSLEMLTGDEQQGRIGTTVNRLAVEVWSLGRTLVPGETVTFTVTAGTGSLSATEVTTGEEGVAATILTLGDTPGLVTVEARWRDQTVVFRITAIQ